MKPLFLVFILISTSFIQINSTRRNLSAELQTNLKRITEICTQLKKDVIEERINYIKQFDEYLDFFLLDPKREENFVKPYLRVRELKNQLSSNEIIDDKTKNDILKEIERMEKKVNSFFESTDLAFGTYSLCHKMLLRQLGNHDLINSIDSNNPVQTLKTILKLKIDIATGNRRRR